jgi:hypothetical protein
MVLFTIKEFETFKKRRRLNKIAKSLGPDKKAQGLDSLIYEFRAPALEYVKGVADHITMNSGVQSIQFETLFYHLLSEGELELIQQNVADKKEPMKGVGFIENGKYDVDKIIGLYDVAKLYYTSSIKDMVEPEKQKHFESLEQRTESSTFYRYFHGLNGRNHS